MQPASRSKHFSFSDAEIPSGAGYWYSRSWRVACMRVRELLCVLTSLRLAGQTNKILDMSRGAETRAGNSEPHMQAIGELPTDVCTLPSSDASYVMPSSADDCASGRAEDQDKKAGDDDPRHRTLDSLVD